MEEPEILEVVILEFLERGEAVPRAKTYHVHIDGKKVAVQEQFPTGWDLLAKVDRRPCAFELVEENAGHDNDEVEPDEKVDLRKPGLKGFITVHKEIVTIFIQGDPFEIKRGDHTVADILAKVHLTPETHILLEEKDGAPTVLPPNRPVPIVGCEIFHWQVKSGGSSK